MVYLNDLITGFDQAMKVLTEEARTLAGILLEHHWKVCGYRTEETVIPGDMLPYGKLCKAANLEYLTRTVGIFLYEIAEWCADRGLPPLNALAVNGQTKMPGEGYDEAPGCSEIAWWEEVKACIRCDRYPATISS